MSKSVDDMMSRLSARIEQAKKGVAVVSTTPTTAFEQACLQGAGEILASFGVKQVKFVNEDGSAVAEHSFLDEDDLCQAIKNKQYEQYVKGLKSLGCSDAEIIAAATECEKAGNDHAMIALAKKKMHGG